MASRRDDLIYFDEINSLFLLLRKSVLGNLTGAVFLVWIMWDQVSVRLLLGWLAAHAVNQAWRLALFYRYRNAGPGPEAIHRWGRLWTLGAVLSGIIWGSSTFLFFVPGSATYQALLLITLFAVSAAGLPLIARHMPALYGFVLPALLPINLRFLAQGGEGHTFLGIVGLITLATILTFGRDLNRVVRDSLEKKYENLELIEDLKAQTIAAEEAKREADIANRSKSKFLAAASHDLRQPLHALGLFAGALSERIKDPGVKDVIASINASVDALERLFNELLDISKLDAGVIQPQPASFSVRPLLTRLQLEYAPEAEEKGLQLRMVRSGAEVHTDPVLLERILRNLISNAIRYTRKGKVLVGCRRREGTVRVEVWDTGVGIPETERQQIFEEFYQAGNPERHSKKGLGLGLAIVKRLTMLLGHPLTLDSRLGKGTVFRLELPIARGQVRETGGTAPPDQPGEGLAGRLIVVIDDEESILEGMTVLLRGWGCEVVAAASAEQALDGLGEAGRYPDLILADFRLQGAQTGVDAIHRLRSEFGFEIPAILITGSTMPERSVEAEREHLHLINKPVMPDRLRAAMIREMPGGR